jgi:hypothetical protein
MTPPYSITRREEIPSLDMVTVHFVFDLVREGTVTIRSTMTNDALLDEVITLQIAKMRDQLEQLAAGAD